MQLSSSTQDEPERHPGTGIESPSREPFSRQKFLRRERTAVNRALWQDEAGIAGVIRENAVPTTVAGNEILVKVNAWAMNPADAILQDAALSAIKYSPILGKDVAGTFKVGDRVLGLALGAAVFKTEQGAFQEYVILDYTLACKIPDSLSFADASVFPLCIATAAYGLFSKDYLGLPLPNINTTNSGVGSNAIQLNKAAGFKVITTCSTHNFDYVKHLGADKVFDYKDTSVIDMIVAELDSGDALAFYKLPSKHKLRVAASNPVPEGMAPADIEVKMIFAGGTAIYYETSPATFAGYLPEALAKDLYQVAPTPQSVPTKGLEGIREALNILKKGISAKKLVTLAK
ncbi:zinc-binding alcohol dehydrogenase family protein [Aspergillus foveolatus]|uniref:zinc-binding alcohol dehydrogenase family protein n=1 Tax=Aspergillus foveolatus TaxID=210207 RepID=UPI003CCD3F85